MKPEVRFWNWGLKAPGSWRATFLHIESQQCLLRRREIGIEITRVPKLDNDGVHALRSVTAQVSLAAGLHPLQLDYFNYTAAYGLELTCRLPDGSVQAAERVLVRPGIMLGQDPSWLPG